MQVLGSKEICPGMWNSMHKRLRFDRDGATPGKLPSKDWFQLFWSASTDKDFTLENAINVALKVPEAQFWPLIPILGHGVVAFSAWEYVLELPPAFPQHVRDALVRFGLFVLDTAIIPPDALPRLTDGPKRILECITHARTASGVYYRD